MTIYSTSVYKSYESEVQAALKRAAMETKKAMVPRLFASGEQAAIRAASEIHRSWLERLLTPALEKVWLDNNRAFIATLPKGAVLDLGYADTIEDTWRTGARVRNDIVNYLADSSYNALSSAHVSYRKKVSPTRMSVIYRQLIGLSTTQVDNYFKFRNTLESGKAQAELYEEFDMKPDKPLPNKKVDNIMERYGLDSLQTRTTTIAITETHAMSGVSEHNTLMSLNRQGRLNPKLRKFWIKQDDTRVRAEHITIPSMNRAGVLPEGVFNTKLGPMRYPGDPNGTARNVVNCRCYLMYRLVK